MRKEDKLILACSRFTVSSAEQLQVESLLNRKLDWQYVVQASIRHGVAYLVYRRLKKCSSGVDTKSLQFLHDVVVQNNVRSLFQTGHLLKLLLLFQKQKIMVVPFKGPSLSCILYGNPAVRSYGDLDILVAVSDIERASRLLVENGFTPEIVLSGTELLAYAETEDNIIFLNDESRIVVELHWEVTGQYLRAPLEIDCFQQSFQEVDVNATVMSSLSNEDLLLYLCIHGNKHMWSRLEWVCCVAELLRAREFDWKRVIARAEEFRCFRMLLLGLGLAVDLLGADLPDKMKRLVDKDVKVSALVHDIKKSLFSADGLGGSSGEARFSLFHLKNRDSLFDSFHYALNLVFQPTYQEWRAIRLPASLSFLYYLFRPFRLVWELSLRFLR